MQELLELFKQKEEEGKYEEALQILEKLEVVNPKFAGSSQFVVHQATMFFNLRKYNKAILMFIKALKITPSLEIASLGLYLSLAELNEDEMAIRELDRFLSANNADLYKTTLEELLEGLNNGYGTNFKDVIYKHSIANNVTIP